VIAASCALLLRAKPQPPLATATGVPVTA
jgi:hypothetical protein